MNYATFWQRFAAIWIDFFILLPLAVVYILLGSISRVAALVLVIAVPAACATYTIYYNGRFGQTIGKRTVGIRIVRTTGEAIGWREALLRSSVDVLFSAVGMAASFVTLAAITDTEFYRVGWVQESVNLQTQQSSWLRWTDVAGQIWFWSELVVMLFNSRRRALHDFIAGTVVISEERVSSAQVHAA